MRARDVMSSCPVVVGPDDPISLCATRMRDHRIGFVPVLSEGVLVGVITDRDLVVRALASGLPVTTKASEIMTRSVVSCRPDDELSALEPKWAEAQCFRVVVESEGRLVGIISLADIGRVEEPARFGLLARSVLVRDAALPPALR